MLCLSLVFVWLFLGGFSAVVQFPLAAKRFFGAGRWYPLLASARHSIGNCGVLLVLIRLSVLLPLELLLPPKIFMRRFVAAVFGHQLRHRVRSR